MIRPAPPHHRIPGFKTVLAVLVLIAAAAGFAGCLSGGTGDRVPHERTAVVTILPQAELVREIAGDAWTVVTIVPPGVEPIRTNRPHRRSRQ